MKRILLRLATIALLSNTAVSQEPETHLDITVFGDSLTSARDSWAENIDDWGYAQIRNYAVAGSRLIDTEIPNQVTCRMIGLTDATRVIVSLGTNDAGSKTNLKLYKQKLTDMLQFLEGRNCTVFLVKPIKPSFIDSSKYRQATTRIARRYDNVTILNMPYDEERTIDGLHPTASQQEDIARWFITQLGL